MKKIFITIVLTGLILLTSSCQPDTKFPEDEVLKNQSISGVFHLEEKIARSYLENADEIILLNPEITHETLYQNWHGKILEVKGDILVHSCEAEEECLAGGIIKSFQEINEIKVKKENQKGFNKTSLSLEIANGLTIETLTDEIPNARDMVIDGQGNILVSQTKEGQISVIELNKNDETYTYPIIKNLDRPHGLAIDPQDSFLLYFAEETAISKVRLYSDSPIEKLVDLPAGDRHYTRSLMFGPDNRLYISIGSSCDVCEEDKGEYASIYVMDKDGSNFEQYAVGLRNSVFMATNQVTGEIWASEMGRDNLPEGLPPDEINIIREGQNYGWPICYGQNIHDTDYDKNQYIQNPCTDKNPAHIELPAHVAPLGIAFIPEEGWPEDYWHDLLIAYHGSFYLDDPVGYKVVRLNLNSDGTYDGNYEGMSIDFISGFLNENNEIQGRPVDIIVQPGGLMYLSDDYNGAVYKITLNEIAY